MAKNIIQGARIYADNCASCHGGRGEGIGHLGPALNDAYFFTDRIKEVGWLLELPEYIHSTISYGRMMGTRPIFAGNGKSAVMAPWAKLHGGPLLDDEIESLTSFVMNWQPSALGKVTLPAITMPPSDLKSPELVAAGEKTFANHCAGCHSLQNIPGGEKAPSLFGIAGRAGQRIAESQQNTESSRGLQEPEDYLRQSVLIPEAYVVSGYEKQAQSKDRGCGAIISEKQLEEITAFLLQQNN